MNVEVILPEWMRQHGLMAQYADAELWREAARTATAAGYRRMDAYAPRMSVRGADSARLLPAPAGIGGMIGGLAGIVAALMWVTWEAALHAQALDEARFALGAFGPMVLGLTMLGVGLGTAFGFFARHRVPPYHHPLFRREAKRRGASDGFFLCIEADDPLYRPESTRRFLVATGALSVFEVSA